ncbi:MAG: sigma-70 family RNA polymerase sigma factor [Patescibacteria group bacterium]|mgnify:CR=1 FL=1
MSPDELAKQWDATTPKLFGYLVNVLRDKALAEDILQSTWLKALQALPRYQPRNKFEAWLFAIARNECKQHWRGGNREVPMDPEAHDIPDDRSSQQHDSILVDQIMAKMTEDDRELLRLRYIADLSMNEIAAILKINIIAVRVRVHRALKRAQHYV